MAAIDECFNFQQAVHHTGKFSENLHQEALRKPAMRKATYNSRIFVLKS